MTTSNDSSKPTDNMEARKQEAAACGPGCGCHPPGSSGRTRWLVGVIVLVAAGVLMARAVIKNNSASTVKPASEFASLPTVGQVPVADAVPAPSASRQAEGSSDRLSGDAVTKDTPAAVAVSVPIVNEAPAASNTVAVKELGALSDLNAVAADTGGVFVFLAGKNDPVIKAPLAQMRSAAKTIEAQARMQIGLFTLKTGSTDYSQVAAQTSVPCVLAMVKGRGMVPVSGEITEPKLIQGFVAASSAGGCGPASGGCGPAGCN